MLTRLVCTFKSNLSSSVKKNSPLSVGLQNQSYVILHSRFVALKELNMSVLALSFRYFLVLFNFVVVVVSRHYHLLL